MHTNEPAGAGPVDQLVRPAPRRVGVGDTVECDVRLPYQQTHRLVLGTPAAAAYATKLLANPRSGWRLVAAAAGAALLAGCGSMTQPEDIAVAEEMCSKRGGFTHVARYEHGANLVINCKDGTQIDMRLGKKA